MPGSDLSATLRSARRHDLPHEWAWCHSTCCNKGKLTLRIISGPAPPPHDRCRQASEEDKKADSRPPRADPSLIYVTTIVSAEQRKARSAICQCRHYLSGGSPNSAGIAANGRGINRFPRSPNILRWCSSGARRRLAAEYSGGFRGACDGGRGRGWGWGGTSQNNHCAMLSQYVSTALKCDRQKPTKLLNLRVS